MTSRERHLAAVRTAVGTDPDVMHTAVSLMEQTDLSAGELLTCLANLERDGEVRSEWSFPTPLGERQRLYYSERAADA